MAAKVALTAEEFRENSQRSIALFNTEKLSTDSTHVLKSAYCNSVHFCRCNLHGACGGKEPDELHALMHCELQSARGVWRQRICLAHLDCIFWLQSARGVWRQRCTSISSVLLINRCNLHGACGGKVVLLGAYNTFYTLQSARGVWKTLHHPPEKNPRKFMQTYCIFIHLGV